MSKLLKIFYVRNSVFFLFTFGQKPQVTKNLYCSSADIFPPKCCIISFLFQLSISFFLTLSHFFSIHFTITLFFRIELRFLCVLFFSPKNTFIVIIVYVVTSLKCQVINLFDFLTRSAAKIRSQNKFV